MRIPHVIHPHIAAIVQTEMSLAIDIPTGIQLCPKLGIRNIFSQCIDMVYDIVLPVLQICNVGRNQFSICRLEDAAYLLVPHLQKPRSRHRLGRSVVIRHIAHQALHFSNTLARVSAQEFFRFSFSIFAADQHIARQLVRLNLHDIHR